MTLQIQEIPIDELIPYANNARTHSDEQVAQIAASIKEFGWTNPILIDSENGIIAGHGRLAAARKLGFMNVPAIQLNGLSKAQKKALILADNKLALNAGWDEKLLAIELEELKASDYDLALTGFSEEELGELFGIDDKNDENPYSKKIGSPIYEPKDEKPSIESLYDDEKAMDLIATIKESKLSDNEKAFLMAAASRHIVFDYSKIANYYAHSSKECQELMEESALVIIDFNKAIENGFINLTENINNMFDLTETNE